MARRTPGDLKYKVCLPSVSSSLLALMLSAVPAVGWRIQFRVGATGGADYVLEATTGFSAWTPLLTNSTGAFVFPDSTRPGNPLQFYRTRQVP